MTAEKDPARESTVNKRYEPPSESVQVTFDAFSARYFNDDEGRAEAMLRYLDSLPEYVVKGLMYHARNGGLA